MSSSSKAPGIPLPAAVGSPSTAVTASAVAGSLRKLSEDSRLRPFLNPLFDPQAYTRSVIKDGKSEESFSNIISCIDDVNLEIKSYISKHKDELMSGMQDVASLAEKYSNLSVTSQKLHQNIERLKKETFESHSIVTMRTAELERIHNTGLILYQLKSFVHFKVQLDEYLQHSQDNDIRGIANAAKTISELEKLLQNPQLLEIKMVRDSVTSMKLFGKNIRSLAQERLLSAVSERNQASIASSLQVFYNLDSLPEVILLVIDTTVKNTVDSSRAALDIENINTMLQHYLHPNANNTGAPTAVKRLAAVAGRTTGAASKSTNNSGGTPAAATIKGPVSLQQLRLAIREVSHLWSNKIHEFAMQIHVFQRVVAKKEDPTSHEKFITVLRRMKTAHIGHHHHHHGGEILNSSSANLLLAHGQLLELFWRRLAVSLQEVAADKLKAYPAATSRAYPYLRKAAMDVVQTMKTWTEKDALREIQTGSIFSAGEEAAMALASAFGGREHLHIGQQYINDEQSYNFAGFDLTMDSHDFYGGHGAVTDSNGSEILVNAGMSLTTGMFGSLGWTQDDLLGKSRPNTFSQRGRSGTTNMETVSTGGGNRSRSGTMKSMHDHDEVSEGILLGTSTGLDSATNADITSTTAVINEHSLVMGLKSVRDKFLMATFNHMSAPILQMFPELEGYTAAIPSKRDLQALINAIHGEFLLAIIEGDYGLLQLVCREFQKTVKLMLSKIEEMVLHTSETRKISSNNNFARNHAQEHNGQLTKLLMEFREALSKIPSTLLVACADAVNTSLSNITSNAAESGKALQTLTPQQRLQQRAIAEVEKSVNVASLWIDELAERQILYYTVELLSGYARTVLLTINKEGAISANTTRAAAGNSENDSLADCSVAVQTLAKQIPMMLKAHLLCLPKCHVVHVAIEEFCIRLLHNYITIASLLRPQSEVLRLRIARDLTALESILSGIYIVPDSHLCPVMRECKSFRRLLFQETDGKKIISDGPPPDLVQWMELSYLSDLRPSIIFNYLIACGPSQLPSPYEVDEYTLSSYVDMLTDSLLLLSTIRKAEGNNTIKGITNISRIIASRMTACSVNTNTTNSSGREIKYMVSSIRHLYTEKSEEWINIENERRSWETIQKSLDILFQRIAVIKGQQQSSLLRAWYETLLDYGSKMMT